MKYLLVFLVMLTSCQRSSDPRLTDEMEREFEIMTEHSRHFAQLPFYKVEQVYFSEKSKSEQIYALAKKAHRNAELFYAMVDSVLEQDELTSHDVDLILHAHRSAMNSLIADIKSGRLEMITLDSLMFSIDQHRKNFPRLSILVLTNNFAINESKVQYLLFHEMDSSDDYWFLEVFTQTVIDKDGTVHVYLNSPVFRPDDRITFIDTVLLNGKVVRPKMIVSESQSIACARFSDIGSGHYRLVGKIRLTSGTGQTYDYPFNEAFEVK